MLRVSLVLLLAAVVAGRVAASESSDREQDLTRIRRDIARLEEQLRRIDDEERGLEAELRATDVEVRLQERQVDEARTERELAQEALLITAERARRLEEDLRRARTDLQARLGSLYRHDERKLLRSFLSAGEQGETLEDIRLVRLVMRRDAYWTGRYLESQRELVAERQRLKERQLEVERAGARENERLRQLARTRAVQRRALELIRMRRAGVAKKASTLSDKERKLSLLLSILTGRRTTPPEGMEIQSFEGALDWPVSGEIVQGFGLRSEKKYRTKIPHNGVEIAAGRGSEVRVVFPGAVVFSAPFEDFGMTVVVHHPRRVFSLYAGLDSVSVAKGDVLSFSDVLGVVRGNLYFELRVDNRPQDPQSWLR